VGFTSYGMDQGTHGKGGHGKFGPFDATVQLGGFHKVQGTSLKSLAA
jgi:hypothetical protein